MPRVALVLPATSYRAADFLDAARRLEVDVVVASERGTALDAVAGDRSVRVDLAHPASVAERLADVHARLPLDAVLGVDDAGVVAAAHASAALGLPHNAPDAVAAARDKRELRRRLDAARVAQPAWSEIPAELDTGESTGESALAPAVRSELDRVGLPCVVKPTQLSASRGVLRADTPEAAVAAAHRARAVAVTAQSDPSLLVEEFAPGAEVALDGLVRGGELTPLALFDKPDPLDGPTFEETYYVTPARLPRSRVDEIVATTEEAVRALGVAEGPVHAELRLPDGAPPVVVEVAARTIGGLCGRALRFGLGMSLEEVVLRHAVGLPLPALAREDAAAGALMVPIPPATDGADVGVLVGFDGVEAARTVPGVEEVTRSVPIGRTVRRLPEGERYLGFVLARARTPDEVEAALREAHARLSIRLAPLGSEEAEAARATAPEGDHVTSCGTSPPSPTVHHLTDPSPPGRPAPATPASQQRS